LRTDYGETGIICGCIGVDRGAGDEFSISLTTKNTNSDGCRKTLWLRRLDLNHEGLGLPNSLVHDAGAQRAHLHAARDIFVTPESE
jgi:hypothetical protein